MKSHKYLKTSNKNVIVCLALGWGVPPAPHAISPRDLPGLSPWGQWARLHESLPRKLALEARSALACKICTLVPYPGVPNQTSSKKKSWDYIHWLPGTVTHAWRAGCRGAEGESLSWEQGELDYMESSRAACCETSSPCVVSSRRNIHLATSVTEQDLSSLHWPCQCSKGHS